MPAQQRSPKQAHPHVVAGNGAMPPLALPDPAAAAPVHHRIHAASMAMLVLLVLAVAASLSFLSQSFSSTMTTTTTTSHGHLVLSASRMAHGEQRLMPKCRLSAAECERALLSVLENERRVLQASYAVPLDNFVSLAAPPRELAARLTEAYYGRPAPFVIGVTGGSSSTFNFSWPALVTAWLSTRLHVTVELRNAAQGSTSSLAQAACIAPLVGDDVDLLFWEFAMNEEATRANATATRADMFVHHVEAFLRQAIELGVPAVAFVYIWEGAIAGMRHRAMNASRWLPDALYPALLGLLRAYAGAHGGLLAMDAVRMIASQGVVANFSAVLEDGHHPSRAGFKFIADLVAHALLRAWIDGLQPVPYRAPQPLDGVPVRSSPAASLGLLPQQASRAHCFTTRVPRFGDARNSVVAAAPLPRAVNVGKSSVFRADRTLYLELPRCAGKGGLALRLHSRRGGALSLVLVGCGKLRRCPRALAVFVNGARLAHNVPRLSQSAYRVHFGFAHRLNASAPRPVHTFELCRTAENDDADDDAATASPTPARKVFFERLVVVER